MEHGYSPRCLRASPIHGHGVFASKDYQQGELVVSIIAAEVPQPLNHINHSCDPNAAIHGLMIFARRPIKKDEEVTIDYETIMTFAVRSLVFDCNCGAIACRKHISVEGKGKGE